MLKIWGRTNSINVQKVMWTVGELGLEHEHINAGGAFGGLDDPAYRAMNPNGRVPVIEDAGTVVWESNTIVRYLCANHASGSLWAADPAERTFADRWMDWQAASMAIDITAVFLGLIRTPEAERNMAAIGAATNNLNAGVGVLNDHLTGRQWVAGEAMSMGDIAVGAFVYRWLHLPIERPDYRNVEAYYERLTTRPAFAEHVIIPLS